MSTSIKKRIKVTFSFIINMFFLKYVNNNLSLSHILCYFKLSLFMVLMEADNGNADNTEY